MFWPVNPKFSSCSWKNRALEADGDHHSPIFTGKIFFYKIYSVQVTALHMGNEKRALSQLSEEILVGNVSPKQRTGMLHALNIFLAGCRVVQKLG
jgi:hypothetical protein